LSAQLPTAFSHAVAALGIGACFYRPEIPKRVWLLGAACSVAPDLDVIGFRFGIHYGDVLGHRGLTHSIPFAVAVTTAMVALCFRNGLAGISRRSLWLYLFLAMASHGLLDALTNGGLGIALLAPFDNSRYFFPVRPIEVSPIGIKSFLRDGGFAVLESEVPWVWVPSLLLAAAAIGWKRARRSSPATA
jgi:inner membrane protein